MILKTSYLSSVLIDPKNFNDRVERTIARIKQILGSPAEGGEFDTVVFRGISGALVAPIIASSLNKYLSIVRKEDGSHSGLKLEGNIGIQKYIIVDDFVATGNTVREIVNTVRTHNTNICNCLGVFLYAGTYVESFPVYINDERTESIMAYTLTPS